jgi:protein gp37
MSKIEWTEQTWNPIIGCSKVSEGCENCYAEKMAFRLMRMRVDGYEFVLKGENYEDPDNFKFLPQWNGETHLVKSALEKPLKRKKPTKYFVCSMGDLFHESVPFEWVDKVIDSISKCKQHTFQILTKRPERMLAYWKQCYDEAGLSFGDTVPAKDDNIQWGVSVENQEQANKRIPILLKIPVGFRFVSIEPMLGPIDFYDIILGNELYHSLKGFGDISGSLGHFGGPKLDWVICGGESGKNARPVHPNWVRSIRDQCKDSDVPFFFKQWGEYVDIHHGYDVINESKESETHTFGSQYTSHNVYKVGKKKAGHLLDGVEHREMPKVEQPQICYKTDKPCEHNCKGLCKESC